MVPGVALAALATLGLGIVLGPEAPLIAIGTGVAVFTVRLAKRDAPPTLLLVLGAAGAFAAISVVFGSPIVAAVVIIEASGLGGATLPLILIPGLIAAGIGSLVFIGMANWTGLSTSAYSLAPLQLAPFGTPTLGEIGWTILLGIAAALVTYPVRQIGLRIAGSFRPTRVRRHPDRRARGGRPCVRVSRSHRRQRERGLVLRAGRTRRARRNAGTLSVGTLLILVLCKGVAWAVSLGSFRGGPTFPAMFLGAAGGIARRIFPACPRRPSFRSAWVR